MHENTTSTCECTCRKVGCAVLRPLGAGSKGGTSHGTEKRYDAGCRCEECTKAKTDASKDRHRKKNERTMLQAHNRGKHWTGPELDIAMRDDLTAAEAAAMLGRTYAAVMQARNRCKSDPKWQRVIGART